MNNLKYIVGGTMMGGAFGAKIGQYAASLLNVSDAFHWTESALLLGLLAGLVTSMMILLGLAASSREKDSIYFNTQNKPTVSSL